MRKYETIFVIDSLLKTEEIENIITKYEKFISANGGKIDVVERWGKKRLAYEIKKRQYGYYVYIRLDGPPTMIKQLDREYRLNESLLRYKTFKLDKLQLNCSGGSDTHLKLEVETLSCETSGGSDLVLSGKAQKLELNASGGSDFKGKDLEVTNARINTSGASDARIHVTGEVEMIASGASDIYCSGNPKVLVSKASGGADIHP